MCRFQRCIEIAHEKTAEEKKDVMIRVVGRHLAEGIIFNRGYATRGTSAVTSSGSDSPIHQQAINTAVAAIRFASGRMPAGGGHAEMTANSDIPRGKPAVFCNREESVRGVTVSAMPIVALCHYSRNGVDTKSPPLYVRVC